jgi:hypothetical protein
MKALQLGGPFSCSGLVMTVSRLVSLFSSFGYVPVEVQEVSDQIVEWGYYSDITIAPFDGPVEHLRGNIVVYESKHVYGNVTTHCVIRYNKNSPVEWQRLVCVKELIHALDPVYLRIDTREKAERFLEEFSYSGDTSAGMGLPALFEEAATYQALGVLCPDLAIERLTKRGASLKEIAQTLDIPLTYAATVVQPDWPEVRARFVAFLI